mmetsp:Transcript_8632/g.30608  ORF Transcript_8632/g.30608 Transcript_8632/m.30608 type:complete len:569 (-) Transcript_8632:2655-4361(-)
MLDLPHAEPLGEEEQHALHDDRGQQHERHEHERRGVAEHVVVDAHHDLERQDEQHHARHVHRRHEEELRREAHLIQRAHALFDTLIQAVLQPLPPRLALQEAVARVHEVVVHLPAVEELLHVVQEHVARELEHKNDDGEQQVELHILLADAVQVGDGELRPEHHHHDDEERLVEECERLVGVASERVQDGLHGLTAVDGEVDLALLERRALLLLLDHLSLERQPLLEVELLAHPHGGLGQLLAAPLDERRRAGRDVHALGNEQTELDGVREQEVGEIVGAESDEALDQAHGGHERAHQEVLLELRLEHPLAVHGDELQDDDNVPQPGSVVLPERELHDQRQEQAEHERREHHVAALPQRRHPHRLLLRRLVTLELDLALALGHTLRQEDARAEDDEEPREDHEAEPDAARAVVVDQLRVHLGVHEVAVHVVEDPRRGVQRVLAQPPVAVDEQKDAHDDHADGQRRHHHADRRRGRDDEEEGQEAEARRRRQPRDDAVEEPVDEREAHGEEADEGEERNERVPLEGEVHDQLHVVQRHHREGHLVATVGGVAVELVEHDVDRDEPLLDV